MTFAVYICILAVADYSFAGVDLVRHGEMPVKQ